MVEFLIGFAAVLVGWLWFFRQRHTLTLAGILKILGGILVALFFSATLTAIAVCVSLIILLGGLVILKAGLSGRPSIQKMFGPRETLQNNLRLLGVAILFLWTFSVSFQFANVAAALIQGPRVVSTPLAVIIDNLDGNKIKLVFDGPVEPIMFLDVLLPAEYGSNFHEGQCYQVTYFYSPIPPVIATETYVTHIREVSECKPQ